MSAKLMSMKDATYVPCESCGMLNRVKQVPSGISPVCGKCKAGLAYHDGVVEVLDRGFSVLVAKAPVPIIVDFWAEWCGPCRFFAPVFEKVAKERFGEAVFARLNTESAPMTAQTHRITAIPTIAAFSNGRELHRETGAFPEPALLQFLDAVLRQSA
jgi:thioredoxin 2